MKKKTYFILLLSFSLFFFVSLKQLAEVTSESVGLTLRHGTPLSGPLVTNQRWADEFCPHNLRRMSRDMHVKHIGVAVGLL